MEFLNLASMQATSWDILRIVESLKLGGILVLPTETVYGISVLLSRPNAVAGLHNFKGRRPGSVFSIALPDFAKVKRLLPNLPPLAERFARRCWPGPMTLVLEIDECGIAIPEAIREMIAPEGTIGIRVSSHPVMRAILDAVEEPLVLTSANLSGQPPACTAHDAASSLPPGVEIVVDGGPCEYREASTVVRIRGWNYEILRKGVCSEEMVHRLASRIILFACTGNTCRSPMAEAICRNMLGVPAPEGLGTAPGLTTSDQSAPDKVARPADEWIDSFGRSVGIGESEQENAGSQIPPMTSEIMPPHEFDAQPSDTAPTNDTIPENDGPTTPPEQQESSTVTAEISLEKPAEVTAGKTEDGPEVFRPRQVEVLSAGMAAFEGDRISPLARKTLQLMEIDPGEHLATQLNEKLIRAADVIWVMSAGHRQAVIGRWPQAAARVQLLDPGDNDIPDPYGADQATYQQCAETIQQSLLGRTDQLRDPEK